MEKILVRGPGHVREGELDPGDDGVHRRHRAHSGPR
jgi:hypothetical protein